MANSTVSSFLNQLSPADWSYQCVQNLVAAGNQSIGYVDSTGKLMPQFQANTTWGIDHHTCGRYCNSTAIPLDFQFQIFASSFVNFLLPWLGLIAQLPTESGSKYDGFISLCMAVGSPAMITYSLMLTIRNRAWVREEFDGLRRHLGDVQRMYSTFDQRLAAIQYVLEEAQQVPLRVSQEQGWFSSLIVAAENEHWWQHLKLKLKDTRRGRTLSLVFQMGVAILAWLFTIIGAFVSSLGDVTTGLQIAAGNIWVWMIPVILGWIRVGTQQLPRSIDDALKTENAILANPPHPATPGTEPRVYTESKNQRGIVVADKRDTGLTPQTRRTSTTPLWDSQQVRHMFNIRGDEKRRGPAFNYARTFTYVHLIRTVKHALESTMNNICERRRVTGQEYFPEHNHRTGLEGDAVCTEAYCGLDRVGREIYAYPEWNELPSETWLGIALSSLVALFLQWGTTGAAMMIAYLTPTIGLGCRSGAYLLYGTNATIAWFSLALSSILSHSAMLRYQRQTQKQDHTNGTAGPASSRTPYGGSPANASSAIPLVNLNSNIPAPAPPPSNPSRTDLWDMIPINLLAAATRYFGKLLVVANALFLVAASLFEFTGGFDNCWCKSDTIGLRQAGWVVLFKTAHDLEQKASLQWGMGLVFSILVCLFSFAVFWGGM